MSLARRAHTILTSQDAEHRFSALDTHRNSLKYKKTFCKREKITRLLSWILICPQSHAEDAAKP